jgi:hypothetical protein
MTTSRRRLSYSQRRVFQECLLHYRWAYLDQRPAGRIEAFDFGSLVHAAVQTYLDHLVQTRQEQAVAELPAVWERFLARYVVDKGQAVPDERAAECRQLLEQFAAGYQLDVPAVWKTEAGVGVTWAREPCEVDDPAAGIIGYLDLVRVYGWRAEIEDWKTSRIPLTVEQLQQDPQARVYAMLLRQWNPRLEEIAVSHVYPRWGSLRRTALFYQRDFDETWQEWRAFSDSVEAALRELEEPTRWKPTPGLHCGVCAYAHECPIGLPRLRAHSVMTMADRREIAETLLVAKAGIKLLQDRLRRDVAHHGAVRLGEGAWDLYKTTSIQWNVHRALEIAARYHIEPTRFLRIDAETIKRMQATERPFVEDVARESQLRTSVRLEFRKRRAGDSEQEDSDETQDTLNGP